MSYLSIDDLAVLQFQSKERPKPVFDWRKQNNIPYAESCFRQIWYGPNERFRTFPMKAVKEFSPLYLTGGEAYAHMMRLSLGLLSEKEAETNIAGQFFQGWEKLQESAPREATQYNQLMQHFRADTKLIRSKLVSCYQHKRHELCARDLSQVQNGDKVLVIGHVTKDNQDKDKISQFTDGICRVLTSRKGKLPSTIHLAHPDEGGAEILYEQLNLLYKGGKIKTAVSKIGFEEMAQAAERYDRIFVTLPMSQYPVADVEVVSAWKNRVRNDNTLTHLKGAPKDNGETSGLWKELSDKGFVSPNDIRQEMIGRTRNNERVLGLVNSAVEFCVTSRLKGIQPSFHQLKQSVPAVSYL